MLRSLTAVGFCPDERLHSRIVSRIEHFGRVEAARYSGEFVCDLAAERVRWVLGSGFALTEFLIAPVLGPASPPAICSLGALVNLMVVICDRLLDRGASPDTVFENPGSPVIRLLQRYRTALRALNPNARVQAISEKLITHMIAAERATLVPGHALAYRDWLRKSALPFALMGLSAWACPECNRQNRGSERLAFAEHLRWLCKVGRFFGAVDDLADYDSDIECGRANLFRSKSEESLRRYNARMAMWCGNIVYEWQQSIAKGPKAVIFKETFLNLTWSWLYAR